MEIEGTTIEINGVTAEIYAEEMGVEYGDDDKDENSPGMPGSGPVTIYRLVKRQDAEAMGISLVEGSVSTPNHKTKVITRHLIKLKNKPKGTLLTRKKLLKMRMDGGIKSESLGMSLDDDMSMYQQSSNHFVCELCTKSFKHASHLKRHVNTHTAERLYCCDTCGKEFLDASTLSRHRRTHTGIKPYGCLTCSKFFGTVGSLRRHKTCHDPASRPYVCDSCDRRFPDRSSFQKHLLIHTGVKKYICDVCEKGFVHVGDLNGHKKIHDDVKPFRCVRCQRDFSKLSNYSRHLLIHEGDKEFKCHICFVGYNFQSSLTRHLLTHVKTDNKRKVKPKSLRVAKDTKLTLRHIRELVRNQSQVQDDDEEEEDVVERREEVTVANAEVLAEEWLEMDDVTEKAGEIEYVEGTIVDGDEQGGFHVVTIHARPQEGDDDVDVDVREQDESYEEENAGDEDESGVQGAGDEIVIKIHMGSDADQVDEEVTRGDEVPSDEVVIKILEESDEDQVMEDQAASDAGQVVDEKEVSGEEMEDSKQ